MYVQRSLDASDLASNPNALTGWVGMRVLRDALSICATRCDLYASQYVM